MLAQSQVCFNDNVAKFLLITLAGVVLHNAQGGVKIFGFLLSEQYATWIISFLLVLPYVIFSPFAGWLADRFTKRTVINYALIAQIVILAMLAFTLMMGWLWGSVACFGLLSLQSSLYSPAKQGILKELVAKERIGSASGLLELTTIAAILGGTYFGPKCLQFCQERFFDPGNEGMWQAATATILIVAFTSTVAWRIFLRVPETGIRSDIPFRAGVFLEHFKQLGFVAKNRSLLWTILGIAFFYGMGGALMLVLIRAGQVLYPGMTEAGSTSAIFNLMLGIGIIVGSGLASFLCRNYVELGVSIIGGLGMSIGLWSLSSADMTGGTFKIWLLITGISGGCFIVPLNAYMLTMANDETRGRIIASCNLLVNIAGVLGVLVQLLLSGESFLSLSPNAQCFVLSIPVFAVFVGMLLSKPETIIRLQTYLLTQVFYRVDAIGHENFPKEGGFLIVCNHLSFIDPVILSLAAKRPVKFIAYSGFMKSPIIRWVYERFNVIPVSSARPKDAIVTSVQRLIAGDVICIFAEGGISRASYLMGLKEGYRMISEKANVPIIPAAIDGLFGSIYSYSEKRFFKKRPLPGRAHLHITFGKPIYWKSADAITMNMLMRDCWEASFSRRKRFALPLPIHLSTALCRKKWNIVMRDYMGHGKTKAISGYQMLSMTVAYSRLFRKLFAKEKRIAVMLPPGIPAALTYFALNFAGKSVVGINPLLPPDTMNNALKRSGVKTVITLMKHSNSLVFQGLRVLDLVEEVKGISNMRFFSMFMAAMLLPNRMLLKMCAGNIDSDSEAALIFDFSEETHKALVFSHKNILAKCIELHNGSAFEKRERALNVLPYSDIDGLTLGLWFPVLMNRRIVNAALPEDRSELDRIFTETRAKIFFGSEALCEKVNSMLPSGFGGNVRGIAIDDKKVILDKAGLFHGAGLLECGGIFSMSQKNLPEKIRASIHHTMCKEGTVGRVLPGIGIRILEPETLQPQSFEESGILAIRSEALPSYYIALDSLSDDALQPMPRTEDGYYVTHIRAHFDADTFLVID